MSIVLAMAFSEYMKFYRAFLMQQWNQMTPIKFTVLLVVIATVGYLCMRNSTKSI